MIATLQNLEYLEDSIGVRTIVEDDCAGHGDLYSGADPSSWVSNPSFVVAPVKNPGDWIKFQCSEEAQFPIRLDKGTTTLSFKTKDGIFVAADSRASGGTIIMSQTTRKIIPVTKYILGTMAGGAADCAFWLRVLSRQTRLYELRNGEQMSVAAASKLLSNILYQYLGMGLSIGTMICGKDKTGYQIYNVDSEGQRLSGDLFSVGSGSTHAYAVLDSEYDYNLEVEDAKMLAKKAILHATCRDAASGGNVSLYHIQDDGWKFIEKKDVSEMYYELKDQH